MGIAAKTRKTGRLYRCINTNVTITGVWDNYFKLHEVYVEYEPPAGTDTNKVIAVLQNPEIDKNAFLVDRECFKEVKTK